MSTCAWIHSPWKMVAAFALLGCTVAEASPRNVGYHELQVLQHFASPLWSARGTLLALRGTDGVYVYDAAHPKEPPRLVAAGSGSPAAWSPDGTWLLIGIPPHPFVDGVRLEAVSLATGDRKLVYLGAALLGTVWATSGYVYGWYRTGDNLLRVYYPPPLDWKKAYHAPSSHATYLVPARKGGHLRPIAFRDGEHWREWEFVNWDSTGAADVFPRDSDPQAGLFLVTLSGLLPPDRDQIIDADGRVVARVGTPEAEWTTLSADGTLLAGHKEIDKDDNVVGGTLYVGDAKGAWVAPVETPSAAIHPLFARENLFVCFQDPVAGGFHVGKLSVDSR